MEVREGDLLAGRYRVERLLGKGGMGYVVSATHITLGDRVAIKLLLPDAARHPEIVERFLREGRAARRIHSEHVVRVNDLATLDDGTPYLVMEHLEGSDLARVLAERQRLSLDDAVDYVLQVCEALAEAHVLGIVHRDLKPANLFVTRRRDGTECIKVLDFGIAKLGGGEAMTSTSGTMGSAAYMSPEQLQSAKSVDARSDVWALGVILHELLAGRPPFVADDVPQVLVKIMMEAPTPLATVRPGLPPELYDVVARCLSKDRELRFANVGALAHALAALAPERARISVERVVRVVEASGQSSRPPAPLSQHGVALADTMLASSASTTGGASLARAVPSVRPRRSVVPWLIIGGLVSVGGTVAFVVGTREREAPLPVPATPPSAVKKAAAPIVRATPIDPTASSTLARPGDTHPASLAFDGDRATAWCGAIGSSEAQWIEWRFPGPRRVRKLSIVPGYDKVASSGNDLFVQNDGVRKFHLVADGKRVGSPHGAIRDDQRTFDLSGLDVTATTLRLAVDEVRIGTDTGERCLCISEIAIFADAE